MHEDRYSELKEGKWLEISIKSLGEQSRRHRSRNYSLINCPAKLIRVYPREKTPKAYLAHRKNLHPLEPLAKKQNQLKSKD